MTEPTIWLIRRNCSASPRQLATVFASLTAVSFAFGAAFAAQGFWLVLPFVGIEVAAIAAAFLCYGRHAADFERIELSCGRLRVERREGTKTEAFAFDVPWVRVEVSQRGVDLGARVRVELVSARQRVEVGSYLVDGRRAAFGQELRSRLAAAGTSGA